MLETEVKISVNNPSFVQQQLEGITGKKGRTEEQTDVYLDTENEDLKKFDRVLRIRTISSGKQIITYKGPRITHDIKTREELEVHVKDGKIMQQILENVGFKQIAVIEKKRSIYEVGSFLVSLDFVKSLGTFLEIETKVRNQKGREILQRQFEEFINKLGISRTDIERRTYIDLFSELYGVK